MILPILLGGGGYGYYRYVKQDKPIEVQTAKVLHRNLTEIVVANGRIQPVVQVKISPEVSGEIIELPVKEGQTVKKGDLLLRIKPDSYQASRRSAEASYKSALAGQVQARASFQKAGFEFKRNQELFQDKLISESSFQEFRTSLEVAEASLDASKHQVEVANAALSRADEELAKTTIVSPITGVVSKLNSQLGERVVGTAMMTGTEVMVVADPAEMEARVEVGEMDVVLMSVGLKARLEVDAFHEQKFSGRVTDVANSSKNSSSLNSSGGGGGGSSQQDATRFEVRIRVQDKEAFRPGMSVTAEIETRYRTHVLTVPIQSVTTRLLGNGTGGGTNTSAVSASASTEISAVLSSNASDKKKDGNKPVEVVFAFDGTTVKAVPVKRGISDDTYVEITDGLKESQEVISGGYRAISRDLKDGAKVKLSSTNSAPAEASAAK